MALVTIASTELTGTFSTKKDGTFLGATTQTSTITLDPKKNNWDYSPSGMTNGPVQAVSFVDAAKGFRSAGVMLSSVQAAAHPDAVTLFPGTLGRDIWNHPIRTIGRALGIAALTVDPPTTLLGAGLATGAAPGDCGSAMWEDK